MELDEMQGPLIEELEQYNAVANPFETYTPFYIFSPSWREARVDEFGFSHFLRPYGLPRIDVCYDPGEIAARISDRD